MCVHIYACMNVIHAYGYIMYLCTYVYARVCIYFWSLYSTYAQVCMYIYICVFYMYDICTCVLHCVIYVLWYIFICGICVCNIHMCVYMYVNVLMCIEMCICVYSMYTCVDTHAWRTEEDIGVLFYHYLILLRRTILSSFSASSTGTTGKCCITPSFLPLDPGLSAV